MIEGLIAAPHTPFRPNGDLWLEQVERQAEHLSRTGVSGVFVGGSTGEATSLTVEERHQLIESWCAATQNNGLQVIAHVGHNCQRDSIEMAERAAARGVFAISSFAPSYFRPPNLDELIRFLRPIAEAGGSTPFYFYDIPVMTHVELPMKELLARAPQELPTLAGIKATNMDLMKLQECLAVASDRFDILFGMDENLLTVLPLGIRGAVGSTYNLAAPLYLAIMHAFDQGQLKLARELQLKSVRLIRCLDSYGFMSAAKFAMSLIGVDCGECRSPLPNLTLDERSDLANELEGMGFFEWQTPFDAV